MGGEEDQYVVLAQIDDDVPSVYGPLTMDRAVEQCAELVKMLGRTVVVVPLSPPPIDQVGG